MKPRNLLIAGGTVLLFLLAACGSNGVQKTEQLPAELEVHSLDLHWPVGSVITYDVTMTSETHYYYLRKGESPKKYDINVICNHGYDSSSNPPNGANYANHLCAKANIGKSPLYLDKASFAGDMVFTIYGKVDSNVPPCASGCFTKVYYYLSSLEAKGDYFQNEIYKNAWYYDSGNSRWVTADDVKKNNDTNYVNTALRKYFININNSAEKEYFVMSSNISTPLGSLVSPVGIFFNNFNYGKYKPWTDTAWSNGSSIGKYEGKDYITLAYKGKNKKMAVYKVDLLQLDSNAGTLIDSYMEDCLDTAFHGNWSGSTTTTTASSSCTNGIFTAGEYYWSSNNIMLGGNMSYTNVSVVDVGYDCIYSSGNDSRRASATQITYDSSGNPGGVFGNCAQPSDIKKYIAYKVTTVYVTLKATNWDFEK